MVILKYRLFLLMKQIKNGSMYIRVCIISLTNDFSLPFYLLKFSILFNIQGNRKSKIKFMKINVHSLYGP